MRVLALDLSVSSTGWALFSAGDLAPTSGIWKLADGIDFADRAFVRLSKNVMDLHKVMGLTHVAFEEPLPPGKLQGGQTNVQTLETQVGLAAQIMRFGAARGVNWSKTSPDRWRKHFLRQTRNPKAIVDERGRKIKQPSLKDIAVARCRELGWNPKKHDAAEACGLLDYTLWRLGADRPWEVQGALEVGARA